MYALGHLMSVPLISGQSGDMTINTRRLNRQRLLDTIRRQGPISRADLAKLTALSPPTVSGLVEELVTDVGLLREIGIGASSGGRPPVLLEFNADYGYVVGIDLGSRMMRAALADLQGRVIARREERTRVESCEATVDQLCALIGAVIGESGRDPAKLFAIGIGAPGMTDVNSGRVISATNLVGWTDVPLRDLVQERLVAPVRVDNDANMAALGERWMGVARSASHFVFLALGAGVGAGVVIDGRLHRGHHWHAGEICRMTLDYREWQVDYGERGYLESRIGAAAIPEWAHARTVLAHAGREGEAAMQTIFSVAASGDAEANEVVKEIAVYLGSAIANIVAVLDPSLIVFGGGLSHAGDVLIEPVRQVVSQIVPNVPRLEMSSLGDDAQLLGSVYSAMELAEARVAAIAGSARRA